ncbi:hypothetical protein ACJX0J_037363, partial [Zea mays]
APRLDDFPLVTAWFTEGKEERDTEADSIGSVVLKGEAFTLLLIWMIKRMILPWKWRAVRAVKASSMQSISRNGMNEIYRSVSDEPIAAALVTLATSLSDNDTLSKSAIFVVAPLTASSTKGYESKEKNEKHISNLHKDTNQYERFVNKSLKGPDLSLLLVTLAVINRVERINQFLHVWSFVWIQSAKPTLLTILCALANWARLLTDWISYDFRLISLLIEYLDKQAQNKELRQLNTTL